MSKTEKMCDCNQGGLPCTCKAHQHKGGPVALKCWSCKAEFTLKERADCDGCCWKCGVEIDLDLYVETFAKLGETAADQVVKLLAQLHDANDKLTERDALLERVVDHANFWHEHPYAEVVEAIAKDYKALSASAEPSAPVERDERAGFEKEWPNIEERLIMHGTDHSWKGVAFEVWKARAALERKP